MLAAFGHVVNGYSAKSDLLLVALVGRFRGRDSVGAFEPAAEIDLRATCRAKRPVLRYRRLAADWTRAEYSVLHRRNDRHSGADIIKARRFETARGRSRNRPRLPSCGRIAVRLL